MPETIHVASHSPSLFGSDNAQNGSLLNEEGIYLHGRLIAVNLLQLLVIVVLIGAFVNLYIILEELLGKQDDGCDFRIDGVILVGGDAANATDDFLTDNGISRRLQTNIFLSLIHI